MAMDKTGYSNNGGKKKKINGAQKNDINPLDLRLLITISVYSRCTRK